MYKVTHYQSEGTRHSLDLTNRFHIQTTHNRVQEYTLRGQLNLLFIT